MKKLELFYPLDRWIITQRFGENLVPWYKEMDMLGHNGIDLVAPDGIPVRAAHDGRVTFAGYDGSAGLGVVIRTEETYPYKGEEVYFKSIYWHLKKGSLRVTAGEAVKAGQIIGYADNTGMSTGSHLHFGFKPTKRGEEDWTWWNYEQNNGYKGAIDPTPYFTGYFAKDEQTVKNILMQIIGLLSEAVKIAGNK